jgi:hypothetical protein
MTERPIWCGDFWLGRKAHKRKAQVFLLKGPDSVLKRK